MPERAEMPFWQRALGQGTNLVSGRLGVPIPIFNSSAPDFSSGFSTGAANQAVHGNFRPAGHALLRTGEHILGGILGGAALGPWGARIGYQVGPWVADRISGLFHHDAPTGTSTVGDLNTNAYDAHVNFDTGQVTYGSQYGDNNGYSDYGPYAGNYQFDSSSTPSSPGDLAPGDFTMPDFSQYSSLDGGANPNANYVQVPVDQSGVPIANGPDRRQERLDGAGPSGLYGISNMMVGGSPVINGTRYTDMGSVYANRYHYGGVSQG